MEVFSPLEVLFVTVGSDWLLAGRGKLLPKRISGCDKKRRAIAAVGFTYMVISTLTLTITVESKRQVNWLGRGGIRW